MQLLPPPPTYLAFGSGSTKCMAFVGAIEVFVERWGASWLQDGVLGFSGCSGGSILALLLALGLRVQELRATVIRIDASCLRGKEFGILGDVHRVLRKHGALHGERLMMIVDDLIFAHTGLRAATFAQLRARTGKDLVVMATSVVHRHAVTFSAATTPDESVAAAVRASCAIPFVFDRVETVDGDVLVDGAIATPLPVRCFDAEEEEARTLGLYLRVRRRRPYHATHGLRAFAAQIVDMVLDPASERAVEEDAHRTIVIEVPDFEPTQLELTLAEKENLIQCGRDAASRHSEERGDPALRRLLVSVL